VAAKKVMSSFKRERATPPGQSRYLFYF